MKWGYVVKPILVLHRYLGVGLGVLMTLWCLSGFVMMYQSFPATTPAEREAAATPLNLEGCCNYSALPFRDEAPVAGLRIEMLRDQPVVRNLGRGGAQIHDLRTGERLAELDAAGVRDIATRFAAAKGATGAIKSAEQIKIDQWTVQNAARSSPVWKVAFDDPKQSVVYVSGKSHDVIQDTNSGERILSWLGAIPHWLYPTILREDGKLWTQVVIWSSAAGAFLTITGLIVGFVKLRYGKKRLIPYRKPMWFLHHVLGTVVGALVLTWVFSGLLTMQPWGLFESEAPSELSKLNGRVTWGQARQMLGHAQPAIAEGDVVQVRTMAVFEEPFLVVKHRGGREERFGLEGKAPLTPDGLATSLEALGGLWATTTVDKLDQEDAYYYGHHTSVKLPVIRVTLKDPDQTHVYLDFDTGEVLRVADATSKRYRWLESGLHTFDFPVLRSRPVWDIVVLLLLAAVTAMCATGAWLSFTRVGRDATWLAQAVRKLFRKPPEQPPAAN